MAAGTGVVTERSMDLASPAMQMPAAYLGRLFEIADSLTAPQRMDAGHAAIDLLVMALRDVVPSVPGCDGSAEVLLEMMRRHVREHLADPHLQVEELARRHHVSVSHVYALFERIGTTPRCLPPRATPAPSTGDAVRPEARPPPDVGHRGCGRVSRPQDVRTGVPAAVRDDARQLAQ
ncbi:hypothetical protein GCM10010464_19390 [Pseudonocardia yunnanensis]